MSAFNNIKSAVEQNSGSFGSITSVLSGVKDALFNAFEFCKPALNWIKDTGLPLVVNALSGVVSGATAVYNFFVNNWSLIAPVIAGIAGAILVYKGAVMAINLVQNAWAICQGVCTAAQWALNVAMSANPTEHKNTHKRQGYTYRQPYTLCINLKGQNSDGEYINLGKTVVLLPYANGQKFIVIGVVI